MSCVSATCKVLVGTVVPPLAVSTYGPWLREVLDEKERFKDRFQVGCESRYPDPSTTLDPKTRVESVALNVKRTRDAAQVHRQTSPTRLPYGLPSFTVMACCCNASCDTIVDFVYVVSLLKPRTDGLGRVAHGSWGQIGVQPDALRVLYIKGVFCSHLKLGRIHTHFQLVHVRL